MPGNSDVSMKIGRKACSKELFGILSFLFSFPDIMSSGLGFGPLNSHEE
jgi:hypothetical protein